MKYVNEEIIDCERFEDGLTDYLEKTADAQTRRLFASHALSCVSCHTLMNEVKEAIAVCREMAIPKSQVTALEARILSATMPDSAMGCEVFEDHLTDYLDGFLPAAIFHRWERHATICNSCTDLPGEVVRSIAACYTYKSEELPVPAGLHERILKATIGAEIPAVVKHSTTSRFGDWIRSLSFPISVPQLAPVAMMVVVAFFVFSQTVSADGSISGMYQKSFELAEQTYKQGAEIWSGEVTNQTESGPAAVDSNAGGGNQ